MKYRIASVADAVGLAELRWLFRSEERDPRESREAFFDRFSAFVRDVLPDGRWTVWVAEDADGSLVSNVWVYRVPKVPSPGVRNRDFGYVTNVYTRSDRRNRGIGSSLVDEVLAWGIQIDLELLIVWPSDRSVAFYGRAGFARPREMLERELAGYEE